MEWRPDDRSTITMTHVNSSVMLFVDGKALSVQNLAKKSDRVSRSVAMGLIGGKGFVDTWVQFRCFACTTRSQNTSATSSRIILFREAASVKNMFDLSRRK